MKNCLRIEIYKYTNSDVSFYTGTVYKICCDQERLPLLAILKCKHTKNLVLINSFYGKIHKTKQTLYTIQSK